MDLLVEKLITWPSLSLRVAASILFFMTALSGLIFIYLSIHDDRKKTLRFTYKERGNFKVIF